MNVKLAIVAATVVLGMSTAFVTLRDFGSAPTQAPRTSGVGLGPPHHAVSDASVSAEPIAPIPPPRSLDKRIVDLGRALFHDARLSSDGTISCSSCHDVSQGGADSRALSRGVGGSLGERNAPPVLNCSLNFKQFWDGRADTLEEQIDGPIQRANEMNTNWAAVVAKVAAAPEYAEAFRDAYGRPVDEHAIKNAIATYERSLITPNSRFDRFLGGDASALTTDEQRGYELFRDIGCIACHQGANIGGNLFQKFGIKANYFEDRGHPTTSDLGRFNITGKERDRFKFKVPTLRNISKTAPYFHDGSVATLEEAVRIMAHYQIGETIEDAEVLSIVAFLRTLDGECDE